MFLFFNFFILQVFNCFQFVSTFIDLCAFKYRFDIYDEAHHLNPPSQVPIIEYWKHVCVFKLGIVQMKSKKNKLSKNSLCFETKQVSPFLGISLLLLLFSCLIYLQITFDNKQTHDSFSLSLLIDLSLRESTFVFQI